MDLNWDMLTDGFNPKKFHKGYIFYNQQELCEDVFIIKSGRVGMHICSPEGSIRTSMILDKGCIFGNQTLFDSRPNSCLAEAVSDEGTEVYILPKKLVQRKLQEDPSVGYNMLIQSNRMNRVLLTQMALMSFLSSECRVCFFLLHMANQYAFERNDCKYMNMRFTHQQIATFAGLSRVRVSNIISGLVKEGILKKSSANYQIMDYDRLRDKAGYYRSDAK